MLPLNPSPEIEGMLCIFQDGQEDKNRPVSQEKSDDKGRGKDSSQGRKDRGIGCGGQQENDSCRATEDLQKDKKDKKDLKPGKKDEKNGKDKRIERERKDPERNLRGEIQNEEKDVKRKKSGKVSHGDDEE